MNAYKCDRCGRLFEPMEATRYNKYRYRVSWYKETIDGMTYDEKRIDLCPVCVSEFGHWCNNETLFDMLCRHGEEENK